MLSHTACATLLTEPGEDVTTREYEYLKTVSAIYEPDESVTKLHIYRSRDNGNCRASTRLSEIYAFSHGVRYIAHRTGPKEVLEGVENRCQTFLTTYKQLDHIPPPEYGLNYL